MKLIGITTCGTYYCPWFPYGIASFYFCDEIVVVNGGYDLSNPQKDKYNIPLKRVSKDIERIDMLGKIIEVKDFTLDDLEKKAVLATEKDHPEGDWFDMRAVCGTLANETAVKRGADMILKWDSDQVGYKNARWVRGLNYGVILKQYEFSGDVFHLADPPPASPFNDSVFTYKAYKGQWYYGGLAPVIAPATREPFPHSWCAHLRFANPLGLSHEEKFRHFYERMYFHLYTNEFSEWTKELEEKARKTALQLLERVGKPSDVPPPEVTLTDPLKYIEVEYL